MGETVLERWTRLEALMDTAAVRAACREAVRCLEVIAALDDEAGQMARAALLRVEIELKIDA